MRLRFSLLLLLLLPASHAASAQSGFIARYEARALRIEQSEPHWATPLITNTPVLDQSLRADFRHATEKGNARLWNLDASKGLKLVFAPRLEADANFSPYDIHSGPGSAGKARDGFGDFSYAGKFRILSRDPAHGNYLLTAIFQGSAPTGSYANGAAHAVFTPTLGGGKGWGSFDLFSTLGASLPRAGTQTAGRSLAWNTVSQYRLDPHWWLELENNASFQKGGTSDGQHQNYLTPGVLSRWRNNSRRGITLGVGMQFATSRQHSLDHNLLLSARLHF